LGAGVATGIGVALMNRDKKNSNQYVTEARKPTGAESEFDREINTIKQNVNDIVNYIDVLFYCIDRKSTRLNSSHVSSSYAVFCFASRSCLLSFPTRRSSDLLVLVLQLELVLH